MAVAVHRELLGEMYRYRLAMHRQEQRVADARALLEARREAIDEAVWEALVATDWTEESFVKQHEALQLTEIPEVWTLKSEVQFLLTASRGIYLMSRALAEGTPSEAAVLISDAVSEFEAAQPDAGLLRNIHEHLDEYIQGKGHESLEAACHRRRHRVTRRRCRLLHRWSSVSSLGAGGGFRGIGSAGGRDHPLPR